jgi:hypothetical protein
VAGTGPNQWDASPVHVLMREIQTIPHLAEKDRLHLRLIVERIMERICDWDDLAMQMASRSLCTTYAGVIQAQSRALASKPGTDAADKAWTLCAKLQDQLTKRLMDTGLRGGKGKGRKGPEVGAGFTPPRERRPSELDASTLAGATDGSDD